MATATVPQLQRLSQTRPLLCRFMVTSQLRATTRGLSSSYLSTAAGYVACLLDPFPHSVLLTDERHPSCMAFAHFFRVLAVINYRVAKTPIHKQIAQVFARTTICRPPKDIESDRVGREPVRHPIYCVNVLCDPAEYDICFEPAKAVIEFRDWEIVLHSVEAAAVACFTEHGHLAYLSLDSGATTSDDPPPVKITPSSTSFGSHSKALVPVPSAVGMLPLTPREGALVPVGAINTRFTTESEQAAPLHVPVLLPCSDARSCALPTARRSLSIQRHIHGDTTLGK
eukprot:m.353948 g.353948  ORF g.353948 m.353948 type:complete len:284 (+) comp28000_c0_seq3:1628-2479(+)